MVNLGVMYAKGMGGLTKNERKAVELYQKAADLGSDVGKAYLGYMYEHGKGGLVIDQRRAIALYEEAARLGNEYAAQNLSRLRKTK
jgi:TPR repeat protein